LLENSKKINSRIAISVFIVGYLLVFIGFKCFDPLDDWKIFKFSLPVIVLFFCFFSYLTRVFWNLHTLAGFFLLISMISISYGYGGVICLNGILDSRQESVNKTHIEGYGDWQYRSAGFKNLGTDYILNVVSWRENRRYEKLYVPWKIFNHTQRMNVPIDVVTKPGKFGFEWIVKYSLGKK
jgi:hypothetical protein